MGIVEEDVARVRAATDFVALAGEHLALRRVGRRWTGLCPFHAEKTPSFSINAEEGLYYCFGCGAKGDVITFLREVEHLQFAEAVEKLASRAGIALRYDEGASRDQQRRARLSEAVAAAVEWYHARLLSGPDAAAARRYLRSRGYDGEVVRSYRLGWAPEGWDGLVKALDLPGAVLRDAGLAVVSRSDRLIDAFRGRIMFPIFDPGGRPIGFGGRLLPGHEGPKYRNSPETALYAKSRVLYGLNWAKGAAVSSGRVVVCEGYTDVIGLHRAGVGEAVATCGTALAEGHVKLLTGFARRLVLAYDADSAGQAAADRFYDWERRFDADIAVADLPEGADPADLAARDPEALQAAVVGARPFLSFRLERLFARSDLHTPEGRARAAVAAMGIVSEHPSELVRDQYVMLVADRCRVDPARLRAGVLPEADPEPARATRGPARATRGPAGTPDPPAAGGGPVGDADPPAPSRLPGSEEAALRLAVHRPDEVMGRLQPVLFGSARARQAFGILAAEPTLHDALAAADEGDPALGALLQRLAVEECEDEPDDVVVRLLERAGAVAVADLQREARSSPSPEGYGPIIAWLKLAMEDLRLGGARGEAEARLIAWLVTRAEGTP